MKGGGGEIGNNINPIGKVLQGLLLLNWALCFRDTF